MRSLCVRSLCLLALLLWLLPLEYKLIASMQLPATAPDCLPASVSYPSYIHTAFGWIYRSLTILYLVAGARTLGTPCAHKFSTEHLLSLHIYRRLLRTSWPEKTAAAGQPGKGGGRPVERNLVVDRSCVPAGVRALVNATQRATGQCFKVRAATVAQSERQRQRRPCMNVMELSLWLIVMLFGVCAYMLPYWGTMDGIVWFDEENSKLCGFAASVHVIPQSISSSGVDSVRMSAQTSSIDVDRTTYESNNLIFYIVFNT